MDPKRRYYFPVTGYNFRLTNLACALLCAQLERHDEIIARRRDLFTRYRELLADVSGVGFQPVAGWAEVAPWLFCITIDKDAYGRTRDELIHHLASHGVETRPFFLALHRLPPFREESLRRSEYLPCTDQLSTQGMNLPTYSTLSADDQEEIAWIIREFRT